MTPNDYITDIRELVAGGKHADALAFADEHRGSLDPPLTPYQTLLVADTLHVSAMTVAMEDFAAREGGEDQ
jgi:hypothetical protein